MRKAFDGLSGLVRDQILLDPMDRSVFVFMNRRRTYIKLLMWEGDGFSIYCKRLEKGTFELPSAAEAGHTSALTMNVRQLQFILQGVSLKKISYRPRLGKTA